MLTPRANRRTARLAALVALGAVAIALAGCGSHEDMRDRYVVEKMWWRAAKLEYAMRENPDLATDEMLARVEDAHRQIVVAFPPPEGDIASADIDVQMIATITARSRFQLAALAANRGDLNEAASICDGIVEAYGSSRIEAVEALSTLAQYRRRADDWDGAVAAYASLMETWEPATHRDSQPDLRILGAPLTVAAGYEVVGEPARAAEWYERARAYYAKWIAEWPDSPTAEAAASRRAESFAMERRWGEAARAFVDFDERYGNERNRAGVWLTLGDIYERHLDLQGRSREYYSKVLDQYGEEAPGATAAIAVARMDVDTGRHAEAQEILEVTIARFPDDDPIVATALNLLGVSHEMEGQWDKALTRFTELWRDYPTTMYGLSAPLHIVGHYEEAGESGAAQSALVKAADHYERVARDYVGTPAEMVAMNHLFEVRVRQESWDEAEAVLADVESRHPEEEWVDAARDRLASLKGE